MNENIKQFMGNWVPKGMIKLARRTLPYFVRAEWEYVPGGWQTSDKRVKGWNVSSIAETQKMKWPAYVESLKGTRPLGINHEAGKINFNDIQTHNMIMSYAYVLALAAQRKEDIKLLDWGGGIGHYYVLSKALLAGAKIDYFCKDLFFLCQVGRELLPQGHFVEDQKECFSRKYDLVLASSSVWYEEEWRALLDKLIMAAENYLYITRMIFVNNASTFVTVQRPRAMGYETEYICWIFNKQEFIDYVCNRGLELVREFLIGEGPYIHHAPEQGDLRGFLFRKKGIA